MTDIFNGYTSVQKLFEFQVQKLISNPEFKCSPRGLFIHEDLGFSARITDPKDRIVFSPERKFDISYALGEFMWYLTGDNSLEMIQYYAPSYNRFSDDGKHLYGAYGPRLFSESGGIPSVINTLNKDRDSRQAVSLIWREKDMKAETKDLPCTVALQFFIRDEKLNLIVTMRSNDIWLGFPYDCFCFTLIQEYVALKIGIELGFYQHNAGSIHMYKKDIDKTLNHSPSVPMESLLTSNLDCLIKYEKSQRESEKISDPDQDLFPNKYVYDLALIFLYTKIKNIYKKNNYQKFVETTQELVLNRLSSKAVSKSIINYMEKN
jgi:thymidylate synthase